MPPYGCWLKWCKLLPPASAFESNTVTLTAFHRQPPNRRRKTIPFVFAFAWYDRKSRTVITDRQHRTTITAGLLRSNEPRKSKRWFGPQLQLGVGISNLSTGRRVRSNLEINQPVVEFTDSQRRFLSVTPSIIHSARLTRERAK